MSVRRDSIGRRLGEDHPGVIVRPTASTDDTTVSTSDTPETTDETTVTTPDTTCGVVIRDDDPVTGLSVHYVPPPRRRTYAVKPTSFDDRLLGKNHDRLPSEWQRIVDEHRDKTH